MLRFRQYCCPHGTKVSTSIYKVLLSELSGIAYDISQPRAVSLTSKLKLIQLAASSRHYLRNTHAQLTIVILFCPKRAHTCIKYKSKLAAVFLLLFFHYHSKTTTTMSFLSEGESESFEIPEFPKKKQEQLKEKLSDIVWPNELEKEYGWTLGAPSWAVKPLLEEWQGFDWEEPRAEMTQWHHYRMKIDGLLIHYVHERSSNPNAVPIVLLHGWPSTFYEFHKLINPLRDGLRGNQVRTYWMTNAIELYIETLLLLGISRYCAKLTRVRVFRCT